MNGKKTPATGIIILLLNDIMLHQIHPNKIRQVFFLVVLIVLAIVIGREMYFMLGAFLGAITLYVLMRKAMGHLIEVWKWPRSLAAISLILLSVVILVLPMAWMISVLLNKISPFLQNPGMLNGYFVQIHEYLLSKFKLDLLNAENITKVNEQLIPLVRKMIGGTVSSLASMFLLYIMLYFMLVNTNKVEQWLRKRLPFQESNANHVITEFHSMVLSNALAIPMVSFIQGLVGLIGYLIFGVKEFILMGLLTAICSVLPVVGGMIIYVPLGVYELANGHTWQGTAILIWGLLLIGSIDNVARFLLQKKLANVHPLITLFGVFIGVNMFGFIGIIFGPLLLSMFFLLVKIYMDEFGVADREN